MFSEFDKKTNDKISETSGVHYDGRTANSKGFFYRINGQNCKIMSYKGTEEYVIIPDTINGKPVSSIGKRAFAGKNICGVVFSNNLRKIGEEAFFQCKLRTLELPEQIEKIENNAFRECEELTDVILKNNKKVLDVNCHAFTKTPYITNEYFVTLGEMLLRINLSIKPEESVLKIPYGIKVIARDATYNGDDSSNKAFNRMIERIEIPETVERIEDSAFAGLKNICEVDIEGPTQYRYLDLGKNVFGKIFDNNHFIWLLNVEKLGGVNVYSAYGMQQFKRVTLGYLAGSTGTYNVYIPYCNIKGFWECMQIDYKRRSFCFRLNINDYYRLMLKVNSIKEQILMSNCLLHWIYLDDCQFKKDLYTYISEHINKIVEYMVKYNKLDELKFYVKLNFVENEKGFRIRHGKYLINKYQNETADYLNEHMAKLL